MEAAAELESSNDKEKIREKRDKERQKERAKVEKDKENDDETIKVYDGYGALRKRLFRTVTVHKMCSRDELLLAAMRAYMVTQDSRNFYLLDVYANGGEGDRDEELEDPTPVMVNYGIYYMIDDMYNVSTVLRMFCVSRTALYDLMRKIKRIC